MGQLYGITPFTLLDFPGHTACVAWFAGCNMRCVFCHNPDIVEGKGDKNESDLLDFLEKRKGKLTGVVFSGGEPTFYKGLCDLMARVREMGFKIKLDTNGTRPEILRDLIKRSLLDYVAMDFKAPPDKIEKITGSAKHYPPFEESLKLVIEAENEGKLAFEVRTTFHADLMDENDLTRMIETLDALGYRGTYFIQNIASVGDKTLGHIDAPSRTADFSRVAQPKGFKLETRNF